MVQTGAIAPHRDGGFATVAAIGVCAALATVLVALLQVSLSQAVRVGEEVVRQREAQALRSAIALELASLSHAPGAIPSTHRRVLADLTVEVRVMNEQAKANILVAEPQLIAASLAEKGVKDADALAGQIIDARKTVADFSTLSLEAVLQNVGLPAEAWDCVTSALTVYGSSFDPLTSGVSQSIDGGIVTLQAQIVAPRASDIVRERTFIVTGDPVAPVLELADRQVRASSRGRCVNAEG